MIWDVLILAICTFVILRKTDNLWITSVVFTGCYMALKAFADTSATVYWIYSGVLFVYSLILFALLRKFRRDDNTTAFIVIFCLGSLIKGIVFGWG